MKRENREKSRFLNSQLARENSQNTSTKDFPIFHLKGAKGALDDSVQRILILWMKRIKEFHASRTTRRTFWRQ